MSIMSRPDPTNPTDTTSEQPLESNADAVAELEAVMDNAGRSIASHMSTQSQFPFRAVLRTLLAYIISLSIPAAVLLPQYAHYLSSTSWAWLSTSIAGAGVLAGVITRFIALPPVELFLAKIGLSSRPF